MMFHTFRPKTPHSYNLIWERLTKRHGFSVYYSAAHYNAPRVILEPTQAVAATVTLVPPWVLAVIRVLDYHTNPLEAWWDYIYPRRHHILLLREQVSTIAVYDYIKATQSSFLSPCPELSCIRP